MGEDGVTWVTLYEHNADQNNSPLPYEAHSTAAFRTVVVGRDDGAAGASSSSHTGYWRYFRLTQTGKNSDGSDYLYCAGMEVYGTVTRANEGGENEEDGDVSGGSKIDTTGKVAPMMP